MTSHSPARKGAWLALSAAALFGLSTPLVQHFGQGIGVFTTAGLLYVGAAAVAAWLRRPASREARLTRGDAPRLLCMAFFGAVLGPVALAWGLQRTSGTSASLMLTLEAVFTAVLAWRMYGETMDRRVAAALLLLVAGGGTLVFDQSLADGNQLLGLLAVLGATAAWGLDNSLSRGVAERDPGQVVLAGRHGHAVAGAAICRTAARMDRCGGVAGGGRHRLRTEPALVPAGAADVWRGPHRLGVWLCTVSRRTGRLGHGKPLGHLVAGPGRNADAAGRCTAPTRRARPCTCP